ncbi:hypothetical protein D8911_12015 [Levilactobacillus brevis]|nr:hypothetical protein D8911_12015 [Levilactobacillus brevis]
MPPVMFSVVTKYHKGRHSLFLYNSEIFYAFTQDILRSLIFNRYYWRLKAGMTTRNLCILTVRRCVKPSSTSRVPKRLIP